MSKESIIKYITRCLAAIALNTKAEGHINFHDSNIVSEYFFKDMLNIMYDYELKNVNQISNSPISSGVDLFDDVKKICIQVTSEDSKKKIENTLETIDNTKFSGYKLMFLFYCSENSYQKKNLFSVKEGISFNPKSDIIDRSVLSNDLLTLSIEKLDSLYDLFKKENITLNTDYVETCFSEIITILSKHSKNEAKRIPLTFNIENKISFNNLDSVRDEIVEYSAYYGVLNKIYSDFENNEVDTTLSVFGTIKKHFYLMDKTEDGSKNFYLFIDVLKKYIKGSDNYNMDLKDEILEMYIGIIVTDAFIKCKIFENPEGYINDFANRY